MNSINMEILPKVKIMIFSDWQDPEGTDSLPKSAQEQGRSREKIQVDLDSKTTKLCPSIIE